jgi:integrase
MEVFLQSPLVKIGQHPKGTFASGFLNLSARLPLIIPIRNQTAIDSMWKKMRNRTGIKGRFHDFRKTFASYYVMNGGSLERLREILGHEDYGTVEIYETFSPDSLHRDKKIITF